MQPEQINFLSFQNYIISERQWHKMMYMRGDLEGFNVSLHLAYKLTNNWLLLQIHKLISGASNDTGLLRDFWRFYIAGSKERYGSIILDFNEKVYFYFKWVVI